MVHPKWPGNHGTTFYISSDFIHYLFLNLSYQQKLLLLVDSLREKFNDPAMPLIACTIGTLIEPHPKFNHVREINDILLRLPEMRPFTATVDARDLTRHIGDRLHYDTPSQEIIGERFAGKFLAIRKIQTRKEPEVEETRGRQSHF